MGDRRDQVSFIEWLGFSGTPDWTKARPLGAVLGVVLLGMLGLLFLGALGAAAAVLLSVFSIEGDVSLGAGALITALLGAPFVIWGTVLKHQTVTFQKEGHMTDRINKAVEQLGAEKTISYVARNITAPEQPEEVRERGDAYGAIDTLQRIDSRTKSVPRWIDSETEYDEWQVFSETVPNIEVRIGAILSLERIAQDSTRHDRGRDHVRVMEILCAYVRENTATPSLKPEDDEDGPPTPRTDIQIAIDVIKRRDQKQIDIEASQRYRLDLRGCDFRAVDFSRGSFRGAILANCRFEFAFMRSADFSGARFDASVMNYVDCFRAKLIGADMRHCRIDKPEPVAGRSVHSINMGNMTGLSLVSANIPVVQNFVKRAGPTFGSNDTKLSLHSERQRMDAMALVEQLEIVRDLGEEDNVVSLAGKLEGNPFRNWSPYDGRDSETFTRLYEFRRSLGLTGWPYEE